MRALLGFEQESIPSSNNKFWVLYLSQVTRIGQYYDMSILKLLGEPVRITRADQNIVATINA